MYACGRDHVCVSLVWVDLGGRAGCGGWGREGEEGGGGRGNVNSHRHVSKVDFKKIEVVVVAVGHGFVAPTIWTSRLHSPLARRNSCSECALSSGCGVGGRTVVGNSNITTGSL
jgi:hypothetical protein